MAEHDLATIAFPKSDQNQIERVARYGGASPKKFKTGEALFRCGNRDSKLFTNS